MPIASVSASPRMYGTKIVPEASGLRPRASMALLKPMPRPIPGPMAPSMARPAARFESTCLPSSCWFGRWVVGLLGGVITAVMLTDGERDVGHGQQGEDHGL